MNKFIKLLLLVVLVAGSFISVKANPEHDSMADEIEMSHQHEHAEEAQASEHTEDAEIVDEAVSEEDHFEEADIEDEV